MKIILKKTIVDKLKEEIAKVKDKSKIDYIELSYAEAIEFREETGVNMLNPFICANTVFSNVLLKVQPSVAGQPGTITPVRTGWSDY